MKIVTVWLITLCFLTVPGHTLAKDLFVDPVEGSNLYNGLSARPNGSGGPFKSPNHAIAIAGPGDTVHLAKAVYSDELDLTNKSGEPNHPLIIDGHGATIDGSRPINISDWQQVAPGLYQNTAIWKEPLQQHEDFQWRWYFIFNGSMNRMGHCMKGVNTPYKQPDALTDGQWTYRQKDHSFFIKIDSSKKLTDYNIAMPFRTNGVAVHGPLHDLIVRNVIATHALNDGFNITPPVNGKLSVRFENIASIECGDDGLSAHGNSFVDVNGFYSAGNGNGLCTTGMSTNNRLFIKDNVGYEINFYRNPNPGSSTHTITNSYIDCTALNGFLVESGMKGGICTLKMDNVIVVGHHGRTVESQWIRAVNNAEIEATRLTVTGMSFMITGRALRLHNSILAGGDDYSIDLGNDVRWSADNNIYGLGHIRVIFPSVRCDANSFDDYKRMVNQDAQSKWMRIDSDQLLKNAPIGSTDEKIGADLSKIPQHKHDGELSQLTVKYKSAGEKLATDNNMHTP
ncbi:MAG: hypothetical protein A2Y07_06975 [Planctomycetes bacterium GWF2_50_10]|nr:MAG: hypothetical protein A2Y07_06975 [Planctomycetes bacterium GWF2_50_10]